MTSFIEWGAGKIRLVYEQAVHPDSVADVVDIQDQAYRRAVHVLKDVYPDPTARELLRILDDHNGAHNTIELIPSVKKTDRSITSELTFLLAANHLYANIVFNTRRTKRREIKKIVGTMSVWQKNVQKLMVACILLHPSMYDSLHDNLREARKGEGGLGMKFEMRDGKYALISNVPGIPVKYVKYAQVELMIDSVMRPFDVYAGHQFESGGTQNSDPPADSEKESDLLPGTAGSISPA